MMRSLPWKAPLLMPVTLTTSPPPTFMYSGMTTQVSVPVYLVIMPVLWSTSRPSEAQV